MSLPRIACWLDYWVWAGAVWILLNNWLQRTYQRNLHPRVTFHGVNVVSAFPWKLNRKMFAVRSHNVSLLIEHSTIFVSTEIFLRCASKRGVTLGQMSSIFQWKVSRKQLITSLLYGSMASWVEETGVSYRLCCKVDSTGLPFWWW